MRNDYYQLLDVDRNVPLSESRKSYRRLARKFHPDVNPGDQSAEDRFKEIQEAYKVLSDPDKRKIYDRYGTYREGQQAPRGDFQGFQAIFQLPQPVQYLAKAMVGCRGSVASADRQYHGQNGGAQKGGGLARK